MTSEFGEVEAALLKRWPETRIAPSLDRIRDLVDLLGEPQRSYPVIHISGTNGKTSTARMIDTLLREFGLRTGRYTSPHLDSISERISLDGEPISPERFVETYRDIEPYIKIVDEKHPDTPMSYFEVLTGMAFAAFADAPVEVAVVEVGLGGSWDATNVADGKVAVITPIGLDHIAFLGDTIESIATEKAGIIKPGATAVLALQEPDAAAVLMSQVAKMGAGVDREGVEFGVRQRNIAVGGQMLSIQGIGGQYDDVFLPLHGAHQAHNAALALVAVEEFLGGGRGLLNIETVRAAFGRVESPGRLEVARRTPTVLLDSAHNPHGAQALVAAITEEFQFNRLVGVVSVLSDKDAYGILQALEPVLAAVVVTTNSSSRALPVGELAEIAEEVFGSERVSVVDRLDDALDQALALAEIDAALGGTGVLVTGSVVTVGDARRMLRRS